MYDLENRLYDLEFGLYDFLKSFLRFLKLFYRQTDRHSLFPLWIRDFKIQVKSRGDMNNMFARKRIQIGCQNRHSIFQMLTETYKQTKLRVPLWKLSKMCSFKIMFEEKWMIGFVFDYNDFELITCSLIKQTTLTKICRVFLNNSNHKTVNQSIERFHGGTQWWSPDTNSLLQTWTETSKLVAHFALV